MTSATAGSYPYSSYNYSYDSPFRRPSGFITGGDGDDDTEGNSFEKWGDEDVAFIHQQRNEKMALSPVSEVPMEIEMEEEEMYKDDDDVTVFDILEAGCPAPPDGGYGWVIVFASFMCNLIVDGIAYTFGVFLPYFAQDFGEPKGNVSWAGSILIGTYLIVGPLVSALTNKFGCRIVCISGSVVGCIGFVLSSFSSNLITLILTYGVIGGFGFGLIYLPAIVCVGYYFEKKRALANGIAVCGSGIGTFIFNPIATWLTKVTDWRTANLIFAGLTLSCCIFGALVIPLEIRRDEHPEDDEESHAGKKFRKNNLLHRMAEDRKKYFDKDSLSGSSYFVVQLPDGTFEKRAKIPVNNVDPGVHSNFHLDQLVFGTPIQSSVMSQLPTITEQKLTISNGGVIGEKQMANDTNADEKKTDDITADKDKIDNKDDIMNANSLPQEISKVNMLSLPQENSLIIEKNVRSPSMITEIIAEEGEKDSINLDLLNDNGDDDDDDNQNNDDEPDDEDQEEENKGPQKTLTVSSAIPIRRKISRERRYSEGVGSPDHMSPPSSSYLHSKSPSRSILKGSIVTPQNRISVPGMPRNGSAPQFNSGRSLPKNTSVPFFDRMPSRKHSYKAVPASFVGISGSSFRRNSSIKSNLGDTSSRRGSFVSSKINNIGGNQDGDDNTSLWRSKAELSDGIFFSAGSRRSTHHGESYSNRQIIRPMSRKDIFYAGSISNLPEYQSQKSMVTYRQSVLNIPKELGIFDMADGGDGDLASLKKPVICPCITSKAGAFLSVLGQLMDFSLVKNPVFLFIAVSNIFSMLGFYVPFVYIIDSAVNKEIDRESATNFISVIGIANTIGRVSAGIMSDLPQVNSLLMNNICLLLSGFAVALVPFCPSYLTYVLISIFFGLTVAGYLTLTSIILVDLLGLDNLTNAFGLLMLFRGLASIVGPPLAGAVYETFQSYDIPFFLAGGFLILSAFISFLIPYVVKFAPPKPLLEPKVFEPFGGLEVIEEDPELVQSVEKELEKCEGGGTTTIEQNNVESSL